MTFQANIAVEFLLVAFTTIFGTMYNIKIIMASTCKKYRSTGSAKKLRKLQNLKMSIWSLLRKWLYTVRQSFAALICNEQYCHYIWRIFCIFHHNRFVCFSTNCHHRFILPDLLHDKSSIYMLNLGDWLLFEMAGRAKNIMNLRVSSQRLGQKVRKSAKKTVSSCCGDHRILSKN